MGVDLASDVDDLETVYGSRPRNAVRLRDASERLGLALPMVVAVAAFAAMWHAFVRPLWYDEEWRAYHVTVTSGFFSSLKSANAPMAAGWLLVERTSAAVFGNVEWALRLPSALSLFVFAVATYRLGRWWLPPMWSSLTASLATANSSLLVYGLQVKGYLPEAACTSLLLCAWLAARARRDAGRRAVGPFVVVALCAVVSLPAVFLIAPLALYEGIQWLRRRLAAPPIGAVVVSAIAGVHLLVFVLPQSYLTHNSFWRPVALAGSYSANLQHLRTAIVSVPAGIATAAYTSPDGVQTSPFSHSILMRAPASPLHIFIGIGCVLVWIVGILACIRKQQGHIFLSALGGATVLITIAATRMEWPIGFVRANLFLVPLLYVLAAIGLHTLVHATIRNRQFVRSAAVVALVWVLAVGGTAAWRVMQLHDAAHDPQLLDGMQALVTNERSTAARGDLFVVLTARADVTQWLKAHDYYLRLSDRTRLPFPTSSSELALWKPSEARTVEFVRRNHGAHHVFLVAYNASSQYVTVLDEVTMLERLGFCPTARTDYGKLTGSLTELEAC